MHIRRKTNQELVVVDSGIWMSIFLLCVTLFMLYWTIIARSGPLSYLMPGFFGLFVLLLWRKAVVVFDVGRQQALWTRCWLFRVASGTVPFSEITGVGVETLNSGDGPSYRLAILTPQGSFPMSDTYSGKGQKYENVKREILEFLHIGANEQSSPGLADENAIRSLLMQGRKIDAIQRLRSCQNISLAEAKDRVDTIGKEMNSTQ